MVYAPVGRPFSVRMDAITGPAGQGAWWFNPRTGAATAIGKFPSTGDRSSARPMPGEVLDWVLVLDDAAKGYRSRVKDDDGSFATSFQLPAPRMRQVQPYPKTRASKLAAGSWEHSRQTLHRASLKATKAPPDGSPAPTLGLVVAPRPPAPVAAAPPPRPAGCGFGFGYPPNAAITMYCVPFTS